MGRDPSLRRGFGPADALQSVAWGRQSPIDTPTLGTEVPSVRSPLFDQANREQETGQRWTVQSSKMLRVALGPEVLAAQGAMVAYQGNIDFSYQGSRSLGGMVKKAVTGEGGNLMRVTGQGEVFFARSCPERVPAPAGG